MFFCVVNNFIITPMVSNFDFLKKDKNLFKLIDEAEKLYRDGYFSQSVLQVRKFGEIVCKSVLGVRRTTEETFDDILSTLSDILEKEGEDKEFIDDMYYIKKLGNSAAHNIGDDINGNSALECLKRAFEISINYAIKNNFDKKEKLINLHYNIDILMSGEKYKFSEKYQKVKEENDQIKEEIKEEINEIANEEIKENKKEKKTKKEPPINEEKKVLSVDFKNKKRKKDKPQKKEKQKSEKKEIKKTKETTEINPDTFEFAIIFSILFVFFICIMIFILPF